MISEMLHKTRNAIERSGEHGGLGYSLVVFQYPMTNCERMILGMSGEMTGLPVSKWECGQSIDLSRLIPFCMGKALVTDLTYTNCGKTEEWLCNWVASGKFWVLDHDNGVEAGFCYEDMIR